MKKVLVVKKNGYNIWADMNPVTKKLYNYSVSGVGANPNVDYVYVSEAESLVEHLTAKRERK